MTRIIKKIRIQTSIIVSLSALITPMVAPSIPLTKDMFYNYFDVHFSTGDRGTVYMTSDGLLTMIPAATNEDYRHDCWGRWKLKEKKQILEIKGAHKCLVLNGRYQIFPMPQAYKLVSQDKTLIFKKVK